jgi:hypothetical protein
MFLSEITGMTISSIGSIGYGDGITDLWGIPNTTAITGNSFTDIHVDSFLQEDKVATAVNTTNLTYIGSISIAAGGSGSFENPDLDGIDMYLTRGEFLVITGSGSTVTVSVTTQLGDLI